QFLLPVAQNAANTLAQGTVSIFNADGSLAASASPDDDADSEFRSQGLQPDPAVADQAAEKTLRNLPGISGSITFTIVVSKPYTTRLATLDSVRGTLLFTGLIALVVSLVVGV